MVKIIERLRYSKYTKKVPFNWKLYFQYFLSNHESYPISMKDELKILVTIAADYGNLGDIAITHAQIKFLSKHFPNYKIIKVDVEDTYKLINLKKFIHSNDIITIIGGGNMGNLYENYENRRKFIIHLFPDNKIISFPQSIDFRTESSLNKSIKVYSKHQNLHIFAREAQSFELMKKCFKNNHIYLVPDIVLSLEMEESTYNREGIILCLRNDLEKKITNNQKERLILSINKKYKAVTNYDTFIYNFTKESAAKELESIFFAFKKAKVVVTDRLHGMIFCAITKTPCLVLPNSNHKIAGTYKKWLDHLNYIIFVEDFDVKTIIEHIDTLYNSKMEDMYCDLDLTDRYELLLEVLKDKKMTSKPNLNILKNLFDSYTEKNKGFFKGIHGWMYKGFTLGKVGLLLYFINMDLDFFIVICMSIYKI
ncbi:polysaccharide pyruvyl transferase family protein [Neobacillus niacini]|uniref:polysaccharide pyruvyl transferase family protein n=1 Tax=Neobacillus niacini TaxID=86668 RepID=UPI002FFFFEB4